MVSVSGLQRQTAGTAGLVSNKLLNTQYQRACLLPRRMHKQARQHAKQDQ